MQRPSSDSNLNPHLHAILLDGVYVPGPGSPDGTPEFRALPSERRCVAGTLFRATYEFFVTQSSHRDALLGPLPAPLPNPPAVSPAVATALANAALDDGNGVGAAPIEPGAITGFVLHPDYPDPDSLPPPAGSSVRRETHRNHIHANLGNRVGQPDSES